VILYSLSVFDFTEIDDEDESTGVHINVEPTEGMSTSASLLISAAVIAMGIAVAPEVIPGIKLGLAARWRYSGLRYPLIPLGSGALYGYVSSVLGTAGVSIFLRAVAVLARDDVAFKRREHGLRFSGYLALHSSLLVLVTFFSCSLAARVHDLPPTPGDAILRTVQSDDDGDEGDGDLAAVGALAGSVLALSRWRGWLPPLSGRHDLCFPWWLTILAGFAGAVQALAMKAGQEGYLQGAARATRAVPYLFYLPIPRGHGSNYGRT
jgi:hypothetical protein